MSSIMESASTLPNFDNSVYTSCYCEENIYWLVSRFLTRSLGDGLEWGVYAVFISNPNRTVALWNQRAGSPRDAVVIWDYHVGLALRERPEARCHLASGQGTWIYDLDTCLPVPCHWRDYVDQTFPSCASIPSQHRSVFRVIPGDMYVDNFASDRSHMLDHSRLIAPEESRYLSKPPPYPDICGPISEKHGVRHNLMTHFVSMDEEQGFGIVMDYDAFVTWCNPSAVT